MTDAYGLQVDSRWWSLGFVLMLLLLLFYLLFPICAASTWYQSINSIQFLHNQENLVSPAPIKKTQQKISYHKPSIKAKTSDTPNHQIHHNRPKRNHLSEPSPTHILWPPPKLTTIEIPIKSVAEMYYSPTLLPSHTSEDDSNPARPCTTASHRTSCIN